MQVKTEEKIFLEKLKKQEVSIDDMDTIKDLKYNREFIYNAIKIEPKIILKSGENILYEFNNDKENVLKLLKYNPLILQYANEKFKDDIDVVSEAIRKDVDAAVYASERILGTKEIVLDLLDIRPGVYKYITDELKNDEEIVFRYLKYCNYISPNITYQYITDSLKNNKEFLKKTAERINNYSGIFNIASFELKNDKDFINYFFNEDKEVFKLLDIDYIEENFNEKDIFEIIKEDPLNYKILPQKFKLNHDIGIETIRRLEDLYADYEDEYYSPSDVLDKELLNDKEFIIKALETHIVGLNELNSELSNDKDIAKIILKNNPYAYKHTLGNEIKKDEEIVLFVLEKQPLLIIDAGDKILNNKNIIDKINFHNSNLLFHGCEVFKNYPYIVEKIKEGIHKDIKENKHVLSHFHNNIMNDKEFLIEILKKKPQDIKIIDPKFYDDKDVMIIAIEFDKNIKYIGNKLLSDKDIVNILLEKNIDTNKIKLDENSDKETVLKFLDKQLKGGKPVLKYLSDELKKDREVVTKALEKNGYNLQFADVSFKDDKKLVALALKDGVSNIKYASIELQSVYVTKINRVNYINKFLSDDSNKENTDFKVFKTTLGFDDENIKNNIKNLIKEFDLSPETYKLVLEKQEKLFNSKNKKIIEKDL